MRRTLLCLGALAIGAPAATTTAQADEYVRAVRVALQELASGAVPAGRDRLAGLVGQAPQRTEAHCHLAEAHRMAGDLEPAIASYRECARLARQNGHATHEARGLLGLAQTLARIEGRLAEAKTAYAALLEFAEAHDDVIPAALVRSRLAATEAILAADEAAAAVRARREERARELAAQAESDAGASD